MLKLLPTYDLSDLHAYLAFLSYPALASWVLLFREHTDLIAASESLHLLSPVVGTAYSFESFRSLLKGHLFKHPS